MVSSRPWLRPERQKGFWNTENTFAWDLFLIKASSTYCSNIWRRKSVGQFFSLPTGWLLVQYKKHAKKNIRKIIEF